MVEKNGDPNTLSLEFVERLYADFISNPDSVTPDWREYFREMNDGRGLAAKLATPTVTAMPAPDTPTDAPSAERQPTHH